MLQKRIRLLANLVVGDRWLMRIFLQKQFLIFKNQKQ
jgi:hypothetical protein